MWVWGPLFESILWELDRLASIEATEAPVLVLISLCPVLRTLRILELWGCQSVSHHIQCSCFTPTSPSHCGNKTASEGRPSRPGVTYLKWTWKSVGCLLFSCRRFRRQFFFPFVCRLLRIPLSLCRFANTMDNSHQRTICWDLKTAVSHQCKGTGENSKQLFFHAVSTNVAKSFYHFLLQRCVFCSLCHRHTWCSVASLVRDLALHSDKEKGSVW